MSQVMSSVGDTDALAAEYVLGTLDSDERAMAHGLLAEDEAFVAKVKLWERRLGELHLMVEPVEPEKMIWERIRAKMPEVRQVVEIKLPEPAVEVPAPVAAPEISAPRPDPVPAATPDPAAAAFSETVSVPPPAVPPTPDPIAPRTLVAPALSPSVAAPPSASAPVLTAGVTRAPQVAAEDEEDQVLAIGRRLTRWRAFAGLMTLMVLAVAALLAAWRFVPERVPPALQPVALMRLVGVTIAPPPPPPRPQAPPESQFDE